jgi:hypothetical protein
VTGLLRQPKWCNSHSAGRACWALERGGNAPMHMNVLAPISMTATPGSLWKCPLRETHVNQSPDG